MTIYLHASSAISSYTYFRGRQHSMSDAILYRKRDARCITRNDELHKCESISIYIDYIFLDTLIYVKRCCPANKFKYAYLQHSFVHLSTYEGKRYNRTIVVQWMHDDEDAKCPRRTYDSVNQTATLRDARRMHNNTFVPSPRRVARPTR